MLIFKANPHSQYCNKVFHFYLQKAYINNYDLRHGQFLFGNNFFLSRDKLFHHWTEVIRLVE